MIKLDPYAPFCQRCMDSHPKDGECIAELEERVVEAAIAYKKAQDKYMSGGSMWGFPVVVEPRIELDAATDALISARESKVRIRDK